MMGMQCRTRMSNVRAEKSDNCLVQIFHRFICLHSQAFLAVNTEGLRASLMPVGQINQRGTEIKMVSHLVKVTKYLHHFDLKLFVTSLPSLTFKGHRSGIIIGEMCFHQNLVFHCAKNKIKTLIRTVNLAFCFPALHKLMSRSRSPPTFNTKPAEFHAFTMFDFHLVKW